MPQWQNGIWAVTEQSQPRALPEGWMVGCEIWWGQVNPCRNLTFPLGLMGNHWGLSRLEEIWCWSTFERINSASGTERLEVQTVDRRLWPQPRWERQVIWTRIRGNSSGRGLILDILCMQRLRICFGIECGKAEPERKKENKDSKVERQTLIYFSN